VAKEAVTSPLSTAPLTRKVIDSLHVEAMVLADEARSYFDGLGLADRSDLDPSTRVVFSCEALKVTTRLMHSVAWLLSQRARLKGEDSASDAPRLGRANRTDAATLIRLPADAVQIIASSEDIFDRIERLDAGMRWPFRYDKSPALDLQRNLERAF
jgi:regulator of CtrA degradation